MTDLVDYDPQDYPEAVAWGQERAKELRRQQERIAKLEAELANAKEEATTERLSAEEWYLKAQGLEAELAAMTDQRDAWADVHRLDVAEVARLTERCQTWHAEANTQRVNAEKAKNNLDELKTRQCETCRLPTWYENSIYGHCIRVSHIGPGFCCSEWETRP